MDRAALLALADRLRHDVAAIAAILDRMPLDADTDVVTSLVRARDAGRAMELRLRDAAQAREE